MSPGHKEALGCIIYGIEQRKGFIAISGEIGVGKTTILRAYLEGIGVQGLRKPEKIIYIFNANLSFPALLKTICEELEITPRSTEVHDVVTRIQEALIEIYKKGETVVLVIDEAQNMPVETLENLRMLSNLETNRDKLIQIVLVGQPEFEAMLARYELRQLNQRIAMRTRIKPLTAKDSIQYIYHRLSKVTDNPSEVFTRSAVRLIARHGRGAPRILNILADNSLIAGFGYQKKPVTKKIVKEVVRDYFGTQQRGRLGWAFGLGAALAVSAGVILIPFWKTMLDGKGPGKAGAQSQPRGIEFRGHVASEPASGQSGAGTVAEGPAPSKEEKVTPPEMGAAVEPPKPVEAALRAVEEPYPVTKPSLPMQWVVKKGESLSTIALNVYGSADERTINWILGHNQHVKNPDLLQVGLLLYLPARGSQPEKISPGEDPQKKGSEP
jgi:general secretion pathway protein A